MLPRLRLASKPTRWTVQSAGYNPLLDPSSASTWKTCSQHRICGFEKLVHVPLLELPVGAQPNELLAGEPYVLPFELQ